MDLLYLFIIVVVGIAIASSVSRRWSLPQRPSRLFTQAPLRCPHVGCGHVNRPGARFCGLCGAPLRTVPDPSNQGS